MRPQVLIVMGSDSDRPVMETAAELLDKFGIPYEMTIASAHRTPERTIRLASEAEKRGFDSIIAGAGMAAHLAGFIAAHTTLPVIGVPIDSSSLKGLDSLLSTVQMPPGVPVAAMSIGKAGARNAAILAAQIIARKDKEINRKLKAYKKQMANEVEQKALGLKEKKGR
jgi:phosphoribosylamine---glycine ligase